MKPPSPALTTVRGPAAPSWVIAGLAACTLLASLGSSIAGVGLPAMAHDLGVPFHLVQWVVTAYLLAITLLSVVVGRLGDALGRQRLLLAGALVFSAASLLCALAPSLGVLVAARALQGLGAAALMALSMARVADLLPKDRAGGAMGLLGSLSAVGTALGPSLGGLLIGTSGWRAAFLVLVPAGLVAAALLAGAPGDAARPVPQAAPRPAAGPLAVPWPGLVMSALVSMVMMATFVVGPFHLARGLGLTAARVGLVMSAGPLVSALCGVPAGRLVDRFGAARLVVAGLVGLVAGALALALLPASVAGYAGPLVVLTAGYALFQAANNTAVMAQAGAERRGAVAGLLSLSRNLGLVAGAAGMGAVFAWATGAEVATAPAAAVAAGMRSTFGVAAGALAVALLLALWGVTPATPPRPRWLTR